MGAETDASVFVEILHLAPSHFRGARRQRHILGLSVRTAHPLLRALNVGWNDSDSGSTPPGPRGATPHSERTGKPIDPFDLDRFGYCDHGRVPSVLRQCVKLFP